MILSVPATVFGGLLPGSFSNCVLSPAGGDPERGADPVDHCHGQRLRNPPEGGGKHQEFSSKDGRVSG